jgi:16S rRNA (uracil1498-N3)-methyltransferase
MTEATAKLRLYVEADLGPGAEIMLGPDQSHYVATVMRRKAGDAVLLFNGRDGEWLAEVIEAGRKSCHVALRERTREQTAEPDLWLLFAPIKRTRLDYTVQKATELGASAIQPVFTDFTSVERVNLDRLTANAIEAAEQCRRLTVPEILPPAKSLVDALDALPAGCRRLIFDNGEGARPAAAVLAGLPRDGAPAALVIGPEGGFSERERAALKSMAETYFLALGPRILRADTAVVAALALWQATLGDWA